MYVQKLKFISMTVTKMGWNLVEFFLPVMKRVLKATSVLKRNYQKKTPY